MGHKVAQVLFQFQNEQAVSRRLQRLDQLFIWNSRHQLGPRNTDGVARRRLQAGPLLEIWSLAVVGIKSLGRVGGGVRQGPRHGGGLGNGRHNSNLIQLIPKCTCHATVGSSSRSWSDRPRRRHDVFFDGSETCAVVGA